MFWGFFEMKSSRIFFALQVEIDGAHKFCRSPSCVFLRRFYYCFFFILCTVRSALNETCFMYEAWTIDNAPYFSIHAVLDQSLRQARFKIFTILLRGTLEDFFPGFLNRGVAALQKEALEVCRPNLPLKFCRQKNPKSQVWFLKCLYLSQLKRYLDKSFFI